MELLSRAMERAVRAAWSANSVLVLEGPRASGKTRLAEVLVGPERVYRLDDDATLRAAMASPRAWIESLPAGSVIDEAQLLPRVSIEAKRIADAASAAPGRLLLTGSHRLSRTELGGSDPLVGRARRLTLLPFTQCELAGEVRDVITAMFDDDPASWRAPGINQPDMRRRIRSGGFPAAQHRDQAELNDWARDYANTVIASTRSGRDVDRFARLFRWLSATSGTEQNVSRFAKANNLDNKTVSDYLSELRELFLISDVPAFASADKTEIRRPRLFTIDPMFAAATSRVGPEDVATADEGPLFETFVGCELQRLLGTSATRAELRWWRNTNYEVDFVLERNDGKLLAIEVKADREASLNHFKGIRAFRGQYAERFHRGIVLHCGDHPLRQEDNLWSLPFSALWSLGEQVSPPKPVPSLRSHALRATVDSIKGRQRAAGDDRAYADALVDELGTAALAGVVTALRDVGVVFPESNGPQFSAAQSNNPAQHNLPASVVIYLRGPASRDQGQLWLSLQSVADGVVWKGGFLLTLHDESWASDPIALRDREAHLKALVSFLDWIGEPTRFERVVDRFPR